MKRLVALATSNSVDLVGKCDIIAVYLVRVDTNNAAWELSSWVAIKSVFMTYHIFGAFS